MEPKGIESLPVEFRETARKLAARCDQAGIKWKVENLGGDSPDDWCVMEIRMPEAREERVVVVHSEQQAAGLLEIGLERFRFMRGLAAVFSIEDHMIEAGVRFLPPGGRRFGFPRLQGLHGVEEGAPVVFEAPKSVANHGHVKIALGDGNPALEVLVGGRDSGLGLRIEGVEVPNHDHARALLVSVANALFFGVHLNAGVAMMLRSTPLLEYRRRGAFVRLQPEQERRPAEFPKYEYDTVPITLYWYAVNAYDTPALRFLAYYQVLEWYSPYYEGQERIHAARRVIRDPSFDLERDAEVSRLVKAVQLGAGGRPIADAGLLRYTLECCLDASEVRELVDKMPLKDYYGSKDSHRVSKSKLLLDKSDEELIHSLAARIYDVRCRIVHTKSDDVEAPPILPYTEEEAFLALETEVIAMAARRVLIANSRPLRVS